MTIHTLTIGHSIGNAPLAFIFLDIAELNGGNRKALNYTMPMLFALRPAHAELGLRLKGKFGGGGVGRPIGRLVLVVYFWYWLAIRLGWSRDIGVF